MQQEVRDYSFFHFFFFFQTYWLVTTRINFIHRGVNTKEEAKILNFIHK